jgi:polyphenol oxidase
MAAMHFADINGRQYVQFDRLRHLPNLRHAFSTRPGDMSARIDQLQEKRAINRQRMAADLGFDAERLWYCRQVHETHLAIVGADDAGGMLEGTDAVITAAPDVPLMTFSADCPLILACDPVSRVVGLAHASWRCTTGGLTARLIDTMRATFGCVPGRMVAGIGPGAGPCCYEVRDDVYNAARGLPHADDLFQRRDGHMYFDLWRANRELLQAAGVAPENIETAGICTMCRNDLFFSFRREGTGCGHFGLLAGMLPP